MVRLVRARVRYIINDDSSRINVSGLSRVDCGCSRAMIRSVYVTNAPFQLARVGKQVCEQLPLCRRAIVALIFESLRHVELEEARTLALGYPVIEAKRLAFE